MAQILIVGIGPDPSVIFVKSQINDRLPIQDMLLVDPQKIFSRQVTVPNIVRQDMGERLARALAETGPPDAGGTADAAVCPASIEQKLVQSSEIRRSMPEPIATGADADEETACGRRPSYVVGFEDGDCGSIDEIADHASPTHRSLRWT